MIIIPRNLKIRLSLQPGLYGWANFFQLFGIWTLMFLMTNTIKAEGTQDAAPSPTDVVMLFTNNPDFGDFASPGTDSTSRLYVTFCDPDEKLYIKLSREYDPIGTPQTTGTYLFQIRNSAGTIVHGPFIINNITENTNSWATATFTGAADVAYSGFYTFIPPAVGDYYIEFLNSGQAVIGFWDFTVADINGDPKTGRLWSRNWALRTPQVAGVLPECEWDRDFNATIYSYTSDGFVSKIEFENSGFQGLSFNINFTTTGPGDSGDPILDRKSMVGNTTVNAEHRIFFNPPDPCAFPDGECGTVSFDTQFSCDQNGDFCLPVTVSQPGQVEVLLDFNNNQVFDPNTQDVLLIHCFLPGDNLTECILWDGTKGDGAMVGLGDNFNVVVTYAQGVQHWAVYDGEFMKNGFCVEVVRPDCQGLNTNKLYWDDELIPDLPGTGQPKQQFAGCECQTNGCRTWDYFDPMDDDCLNIDDDITLGYGDKNTLNTWWFAQISVAQPVSIPFLTCMITGPASICEGVGDILKVNFPANLNITNIDWTGPGGFNDMGDASNTNVLVLIGGLYTVTLTDANGCTTSCTYDLLSEICCPCVEPPVIQCPDAVVLPCNPVDNNNDGIPDIIPDPAQEILDGVVTASNPTMGCIPVITHLGDGLPIQNGCVYMLKRTYKATNECGGLSTVCEQLFTWTIDQQPPVGACPPGVVGLTDPAQVPPPNPIAVAANYTDACSDVTASLVNTFQTGVACTSFAINYVYQISDNCGNNSTCHVVHTGGSNMPLQGSCPPDQENLQCFGEVPPPDLDGIAAMYTGAAPITVVLLEVIDTGDDCTGFSRTYRYEISDGCETEICEVSYSGQDFKAPYGTCPTGLTGLSCVDDIPDPDPDEVATHFWDNCGVLSASLVETIDNTQNCWYFYRTYVYEIVDECGHVRTCEVTHSGATQNASTSIDVALDLTCIDQVPDPDPEAVAELFDNGCGDNLTGLYFTTITSNQYCSGFRKVHFYMIMQECGGMFWAAMVYEGTNCPGCQNVEAQPGISDGSKILDIENREPRSELEVNLYPNPARNEVEVAIKGIDSELVSLRLMDVHGAIIYSSQIEDSLGESLLLDLQKLGIPTGVYYLSVVSGKQMKVEKLVVN